MIKFHTIGQIEHKYHFEDAVVSTDTFMPSLGMLTINALAAADSVIVPVQAHYLPLKGIHTINW